MNNKRMYIICICGCFIIKLFCNLFWYLEPRETMIKLHSDNLKEIMAINPISESKVLKFSLPSKGNFIGFEFLFVNIGNRESTYKYYQNALKDRGWKADKINGDILILKNKMKKGVIMYVDNSQDDIIYYGITNDWEEKSVKTKIEFQNTYKKNIVKRWSKILK